MKEFITGCNWIFWYYILTIFPFQIYDFFCKTGRKLNDYISVLLPLILFVGYICTMLFNADKSRVLMGNATNLAFAILVLVIYMQGVFEIVKEKSIRNYLFVIIQTAAIITVLFLSCTGNL